MPRFRIVKTNPKVEFANTGASRFFVNVDANEGSFSEYDGLIKAAAKLFKAAVNVIRTGNVHEYSIYDYETGVRAGYFERVIGEDEP